jgi:hypothetical protein
VAAALPARRAGDERDLAVNTPCHNHLIRRLIDRSTTVTFLGDSVKVARGVV